MYLGICLTPEHGVLDIIVSGPSDEEGGEEHLIGVNSYTVEEFEYPGPPEQTIKFVYVMGTVTSTEYAGQGVSSESFIGVAKDANATVLAASTQEGSFMRVFAKVSK
jgi:hypothetical protein